MKIFYIVVIISFMFRAPVVSAEPSQLVRKLMETPVTLFDLGILKINTSLQKFDTTKGYEINYSWNENKFIIAEVNFKRSGCEEALKCINEVKNELLENTSTFCMTGKESAVKCDVTNIMSYFGHTQYAIPDFHNGKNSSEAPMELKYTTDLKLTKFFNIKKEILQISCVKRLTEDEVQCSHSIF